MTELAAVVESLAVAAAAASATRAAAKSIAADGTDNLPVAGQVADFAAVAAVAIVTAAVAWSASREVRCWAVCGRGWGGVLVPLLGGLLGAGGCASAWAARAERMARLLWGLW
eukprot:COSAG02_NODE_1442_length_12573_cov_2.397485_11_plen_113_part_00